MIIKTGAFNQSLILASAIHFWRQTLFDVGPVSALNSFDCVLIHLLVGLSCLKRTDLRKASLSHLRAKVV